MFLKFYSVGNLGVALLNGNLILCSKGFSFLEWVLHFHPFIILLPLQVPLPLLIPTLALLHLLPLPLLPLPFCT